jgi:hypothetical protein
MMNDAAEPNCILPIGDDGSLNGGRSSGKLIIIEINMESEYQQPADWNGIINQVKKLWHLVKVVLKHNDSFPGRHQIGVLDCHQLTPPNSKTIRRKIMWSQFLLEGRVAQLILLVVVSVCIVFCVLCSNRRPDNCTFFSPVIIFSSFVIIGVRILTQQTVI